MKKKQGKSSRSSKRNQTCETNLNSKISLNSKSNQTDKTNQTSNSSLSSKSNQTCEINQNSNNSLNSKSNQTYEINQNSNNSLNSKSNQKSSASPDKINEKLGEVSPLNSEESVYAISSTTELPVQAAPLGSDEYGRFIREAYMDSVSEVVVLADDLADSLSRYDEIVDTISKLKCEKNIIEHTIMALMKEKEIAYVKNRKITWKKSVRTSIDSKRLKEEEPMVYEKYCKTSSSRLFKIK